jgi:hypothetical protein
VALDEQVLGQFLGDDSFPIQWASETEKKLFWVFDDLHCPHPLSPMFEEIGGWWLSCDHMFRRFGTPFASDWIIKNVNGYLYTAAVPAEAGVDVSSEEYGATIAELGSSEALINLHFSKGITNEQTPVEPSRCNQKFGACPRGRVAAGGTAAR